MYSSPVCTFEEHYGACVHKTFGRFMKICIIVKYLLYVLGKLVLCSILQAFFSSS